MILAAANDPGRVPPHWSSMIRTGQFAVFVFDARNHVPRDPDGSVPRAGASLALCDDLAEANDFAHRLVGGRPDLCCEIYGHDDEYGQPRSAVYDPDFHDKHRGRGAARRNTVWGSLALLCGAILVVIDFRRDLAWLWGYIVGLKCMIVGTSLLINGLSGLHATANSQTSKESTPLPAARL